MSEKMSAARVLDYIDARQMAKAMARWRVAGDLSDEQLQEDSAACRYLHRSIAELTEDYVPYAVGRLPRGRLPRGRQQRSERHYANRLLRTVEGSER